MTANTSAELSAIITALVPVSEDTPQTPAPIVHEATAALARVSLETVALSRFGDWKQHAETLHERYKGVAFAVATTKGYDEAVAARRTIREFRISADKVAKAVKSELRALQAKMGDEAEAIAEDVKDLEAHVHDQIVAEDTRKEEARNKERERKGAHEMNLARIRSYVELAHGKTSEEIGTGIQFVQDHVVIDDTWEEFKARGIAALEETLAELRKMRDDAQAKEQREAEAERLRLETEAKAIEVKTVGEIQAAAMAAFGKSSSDIEQIAAELKDKHSANESAQVKVALEMTLANLNMMVMTTRQQEQMAVVAAPAPAEAATIVAKAEAIVKSAERTYPSGAPMFSKRLKENGDPFMLNENGSRSVFCDVDEGGTAEDLGTATHQPDAKAATVEFNDMDESDGAIDVEATGIKVDDVAAVDGDESSVVIEHQCAPVITPVQITCTIVASESEKDRVMTTHELNMHLGMEVPEIMLIGTGAQPIASVSGASTWLASDFDLIVDGLIEHLESLKGKF